VRAALGDLLRKDKAGGPRRVIFIASTAGLKGYPYVVPYVAAKHGVVGLARGLAVELAKTPVTVNAVCPGYVETPLFDATIANIMKTTGRTAEQSKADLLKSNPQGRAITPGEVAATVLWLCSAAAQSVTGQAVAMSGGET
jgi:NAD(P)-dependent dehydrogenase (short-subunit alcohol dehydrogenase family)